MKNIKKQEEKLVDDIIKSTITNMKEAFLSYEKHRLEGKYNIYDLEFLEVTGLTKDQWTYIVNNYNKLKQLYL